MRPKGITTRKAVRRMARAAGVRRITEEIYAETVDAIIASLKRRIRDAITSAIAAAATADAEAPPTRRPVLIKIDDFKNEGDAGPPPPDEKAQPVACHRIHRATFAQLANRITLALAVSFSPLFLSLSFPFLSSPTPAPHNCFLSRLVVVVVERHWRRLQC